MKSSSVFNRAEGERQWDYINLHYNLLYAFVLKA